MVSSIQLGSMFNVNGRTIFGGGSSGIDMEGLIKGLADAKRAPAVKIEESIEVNGKKTDALGELRSILNKFKDAANFLRKPPGVANEADNVFEYRTSSISSNTAVEGSIYLAAGVAPGAKVASYAISEVTALAQAKKQQTNLFAVADAETAVAATVPGPNQFGVGTITVNGQNITIADGDSLNDISYKFNAVSTNTGITTSILQVSPGQFQMIFTATKTGLSSDFDMTTAGTVSSDPSGVLTNIGFSLLQSAQNASFKLDGVAITRETNTIDDLIEDVTLTLKQITPPGTNVKLDVQPDTQIIKDGIFNLVNTYNDFKIFASKQSQLNDDGTAAEDSVLFSNPTMRTILNSVNVELGHIVSGLTGGDPSRLADLGIKFADFPGDEENPFTRNIMTIDEGKLNNMLSSNMDAVRRVFEFDFTSSSGNLKVFSRTNGLKISDFQLSIDQTTNTYQATYDPGTGPVTIDLDYTALGTGVTLKGKAGTVLEGLVMIYSGSGNETVDVKATQGVADRLFNMLDGVLKSDTGSLDIEIDSVDDSTARMKKEVARIDESIEKFREQLLEKFSAMEAAIASVNTLLQSLDAQSQARANQ